MKLKLAISLTVILIPILIGIRFLSEYYLNDWYTIFIIQIIVFLSIIALIYKLIKSL